MEPKKTTQCLHCFLPAKTHGLCHTAFMYARRLIFKTRLLPRDQRVTWETLQADGKAVAKQRHNSRSGEFFARKD